MCPQVVYSCGGGRLGNQLLNYANLLGFAIEYSEFDVCDLAFRPYLDLYGNDNMTLASLDDSGLSGLWQSFLDLFWGDNPMGRLTGYYPVDRFRYQVLHGMAEYRSGAQSIVGGDPHVWYEIPGDQYDEFDLADDENVDRLRSSQLTVLAGWGVRAWDLVRTHRGAIRSRMRPGVDYIDTAETVMDSLRDEFDRVVGVLIRHGDYRTHLDGRYFFESRWYRSCLDAYADECAGESVGFLIASDEEQPSGVFDEEQFRFATGEAVGPNSYVENFAELMYCDAVITPPSTFSILAAFIGDVPIVPIYPGMMDDDLTHLEDPLFGSLNHFEWKESYW